MLNSFADMAAKSTFALPSQSTDTSASANTSESKNNTSSASDDFSEEYNTFLTLLTAQIQNQDPLQPMDSTQFVEQLATFSSLEQQVMTNDSLESISGLIRDLNSMVANEWLGQDVSVKSSWLASDGQPRKFTYDDAPAAADKSVLTIADRSGNVLATETLNAKGSSVTWDGKTDNGTPLAGETLLNITVNHYKDGALVAQSQPGVVTQVTGVADNNGKLQLNTAAKLTAELGNFEKVN